MNFKENIGQRVSLLTLFALIVPLLFFPQMFGTQLAKASLVNFLYELVFYGFVIFLFNRRASLWGLVQTAGWCMAYRLGLSVAFGLLITGLFSMSLAVSLKLGLYSYLPGVVFYAVITPFIMKPVIDKVNIRESKPSRKKRRQVALPPSEPIGIHPTATDDNEPAPVRETPATAIAVPKSVFPPVVEKTVSMMASPEPASAGESTRGFLQSDINGFERATRYIGEHAAVHLATVVDHEGLLLANFKRGEIDPEAWAPLALVFFESNMQVLKRAATNPPEKIDIVLRDKRIVVARVSKASLMVVAERQSDDFLNIRINQGLDIIKKYIDERYSRIFKEKEANENKLENINVSSTQ
ncbi:MAG: hypothetical protein JXA92_08090 [candidate division Zixibacteria bacterium]|nr:hypothetical protein [candidate division Zixibacteria bacterium]